jgi:ATP-binding cassette subfamily F protein 2
VVLLRRLSSTKIIVFCFTDFGKLLPVVLQFADVTFGYTSDNLIYKNLTLVLTLTQELHWSVSGAGKSTLLKLMTGDLTPLDGMIRRHNH